MRPGGTIVPGDDMMAWNPTPEVAATRDFGEKFGADRVIVIYTTPQGKLGYASWGETRALCANTKRLAEVAYDAVYDAIAETT